MVLLLLLLFMEREHPLLSLLLLVSRSELQRRQFAEAASSKQSQFFFYHSRLWRGGGGVWEGGKGSDEDELEVAIAQLLTVRHPRLHHRRSPCSFLPAQLVSMPLQLQLLLVCLLPEKKYRSSHPSFWISQEEVKSSQCPKTSFSFFGRSSG